jgi:HAD superfamily hydrolase (TIGR01509 family)
MDGTLVDTEPYWVAAQTELVTSWGGNWTFQDGLQLVGSGLEGAARILQSRGVCLSVDEIIGTLTDRVLTQMTERVPWRAGSREILGSVREAGIPMALVTMSFRRMALQVADAIGFPTFDVIVAGDDVVHPKPHPEPYLRAAAALEVDPTDCIVFEDSKPGIASAVAAGARVIAVPLHIPLPPSPAYALWPGLDGVAAADLSVLMETER